MISGRNWNVQRPNETLSTLRNLTTMFPCLGALSAIPKPPWQFSGCLYSPLWAAFPFLSRSKSLSWLLTILALCLEMSIVVPFCAITASCFDGPCFGVEIPISRMTYSILSRQQQCLHLRVLFFQTYPSSSDGEMPRTIGTNK